MNEPSHSPADPPEIVRLRQLVSMAPNDPDLLLHLAAKLVQYGLRDEAVRQIRTAITLAPNHLEARELLDRALTVQSQCRTQKEQQ